MDFSMKFCGNCQYRLATLDLVARSGLNQGAFRVLMNLIDWTVDDRCYNPSTALVIGMQSDLRYTLMCSRGVSKAQKNTGKRE